MKKKLIAVLATIAVMSTALTSIPTNAEEFSNPQLLEDYETRREIIVKYNSEKLLTKTYPNTRRIKKGTIVGKTWVYIGRYRVGNRSAMAIKCIMNPQLATDKFGRTIYGFSQYLKLSTTLPSQITWQNHDPKTSTIGSDKYSVNISSGGIATSAGFKHAYCETNDLSYPTENYFASEFDYKSSSHHTDARTNVLFKPTYQFAMVEWTQKSELQTKLKVYTKYEFAYKKSCAARLKDSIGNSDSYTVYYC